MQREINEISWGLVTILCILALSCVFKILVVFVRPKLCFSDLTCVSKILVLFSDLRFLFQTLDNYVFTPCLCCSDVKCVIET